MTSFKMDKLQKLDDQPKSLEDFDKYLKSRPDRYSRYLNRLYKCGRFVILALIEEHIEKQKKELKDILHEKKDLVRKVIDPYHLNILYSSDQASSSNESDISKWDITLLATFYLQVLVNESVDTEIQEAVNTIVTLRNTYAEASSISLDSVAFNERYSYPLYFSTKLLSSLLNSHNKNKFDIIETACGTEIEISGLQEIYLNELQSQDKNIKRIEDEYEGTSISDLKANVYKMLGQALERTNTNGGDSEPWWKYIINNGDINVNRKEQRNIGRQRSPGVEFLDILDDRGYTLQDLEKLFIQFRMNEALDILHQHQDKRVTDLDEQYLHSKRKLKKDLAEFHRERHSTIPLSPLFEEKDTPLLDFYLMPGMNVVQIQYGREEKTAVKSLSEVFKSGSKFNNEIYVTAETGFGKTAFSKYMTVLWCQAHFPDENHTKHLEEESVNAMHEFEFIFLVLLRDSPDVCSIDDLIFYQNFQNLPRCSSYSNQFLEEILNRERCLVVLDGLDEWTHPDTNCGKRPKSIPHRSARNNCTFLTTTKPWKFSIIQLSTKQIDKKIELTDMDHGSALELTTRALKKLKGKTDLEMGKEAERLLKRYCDFQQVSVPLLLMYIICLWCDDIPVGQTKSGLYTSIIELLLSRTIFKYEKFSQTELPQCVSDIPECFSELEHCKAYFPFLISLGELAFHTLFSETKENSLVFDSSIAEKCLKEENFLELGRLTGIITQDKQTTNTRQIRKTSFSHKTVQEFFAALYITTCSDQDKVLTKVLSLCNSIEDILDRSKVFIFISGFNAELFSLLPNKLMEVINKDERTSRYRSTAKPGCSHQLRDIQDMYVSCIKEIPDNKHVNICLHDFFFEEKCEQENYYTSLQRLAVNNKTNIKSIYIDHQVGQSVSEIIEDCELYDPEIHCQKISCSLRCKEDQIIRLLSTSIKCLHIARIQEEKECKDTCSSLTDEQCKTFHNSSQLETVHILSSTVSHKFLNYIINVKSIKKIEMSSLSCSDHSDSCPRFNIDLSQHPELRKLYLHGKFMLCDTNEDESLLLHNMRNIEHVRLEEVKMSSLLLRHLVKIIKQLEQSVGVELVNCEITPGEEFDDIREDIFRSESFVVKQDYRDDMVKGEVFEFETRK